MLICNMYIVLNKIWEVKCRVALPFNTLYGAITTISTQMTARFNELNTQLGEIKTDIQTVKTDVNELKASQNFLSSEVDKINKETIPSVKKELKSRIAELEKVNLEQELYSKKSNLLFFNITQTSKYEDTELVVRKFIAEKLDLDANNMPFMNSHRLPSRDKKADATDPIIVKFVTMKDRNSVLTASRTMLSNATNAKGKNYAVAPHLPKVMQQERKRLVPIRNKKKAEGKDAKIRVAGTTVQLLVDGVVCEV